MNKRRTHLAVALALGVTAFGCTGSTPPTHGVYMLLDTSGTYTGELDKASKVINYLLSELNAGDSLAVARIDSGSFSEKDIMARVTFDNRPTTANEQKRGFMRQMDVFAKQVSPARHTDITGALIQAVDWLRETGAGTKTVLIFSDMEEDLQKGNVRDFPINVQGVHVIALNVTKLRSDNVDPREYQKRLDHWQQRVEEGGGTWQVVNDLDRLGAALRI